MGLTPLAGLPMGTRSGDMDAGIMEYLMKQYNLSMDEMMTILNKKSGVLGISGVSSDFRDLDDAAAEGNQRAALAVEVFAYKVRKMIGEYAAAMGGVDVILFTGGAGENQWEVREGATKGLEFMGVEVDAEKNHACRATEAIISKDGSKVTVCVIPTDEELMIALDTMALVK